MSAEEALAPIRARVAAATRGPWEATIAAAIIAPIPHSDDAYWLFEAHADHKDGRGAPVEDCMADAEFIAAAPTDIARLLAALDAVTAYGSDREKFTNTGDVKVDMAIRSYAYHVRRVIAEVLGGWDE